MIGEILTSPRPVFPGEALFEFTELTADSTKFFYRGSADRKALDRDLK